MNAIPGPDEPLSALVSFYGDRGNRLVVLVGGFLLVASAMLLLAFIAAAGSHHPVRAPEAALARLAGSLFATSVGVGAVALALVAAEVSLRGVRQPRPEVERWLAEFGYAMLLVPAMVGAASLVWSLGRLRQVGPGSKAIRWSALPIALVSLASLPLALRTTLLWSQLPLAVWIGAYASTSGLSTRAESNPAGSPDPSLSA